MDFQGKFLFQFIASLVKVVIKVEERGLFWGKIKI